MPDTPRPNPAPPTQVNQPTPAPPAKDINLPTSSPAGHGTHGTQSPKPQVQAKKKPAQQAKGVTGAIVATVIIVLGLAAMAVYAYLKTKQS